MHKRVVSRMFGPKRDEIIGDWSKLHNDDLHNLYSSPNRISTMYDEVKEDKIGRPCSMHGKRNTYRILVGMPEGTRSL
jgi:hypothetical protein